MSNNAQRIMAAARRAPAGLLKQAVFEERIDPRQINSLSDDETDSLVARLESYGARREIDLGADKVGDGAEYIRGKL